MKERHGFVWYEDRCVGQLRSDTRGALHFRYTQDWLESGFPVSLQLPLSLEDAEVNAHGFFQGLLPEGRSRLRICRQLRIEPDDDAALLFAIGEDCAGALSILPDDAKPSAADAPPESLPVDGLRQIISSHGQDTAAITGMARRFSLAGVQEKLPVILDGEFRRPNRAWPSTHILKFETIPHVCFAEYASLQLARRLGFDTVDCEFRTIESAGGRVPFLLVTRYDRYREPGAKTGGRVHRLHQEDTVQALGYETDVKYQQDGGPMLAEVIQLLRDETATPATQIRRVADWQIFNYLIGNFDGHGKNLALLYPRDSALPQLAPFYDLVAIDFINQAGNANYDRNMAFFVGGQSVPERINRAAWQQFAKDLRVRASYVFRRIEEMADALPTLAKAVREEFADRFDDNAVYDRFEHGISDRCRWARQVIP